MDAIIIACANRNIVNYLNNVSASKNTKITRRDLQTLLCHKDKTDNNGNYKWVIDKPWETFTQDTLTALQKITVSFKQNLRVINKTTNHYQHYENGKKIVSNQSKGDSWAIRKSMHKETVHGEVNLRMIKTVSFNEALKKPQAIVEMDLKKKILAMLELGYDTKRIKNYFEENKDTWQDINPSKIKVYYFTKETKDRYFAVRKPIDTSFDKKKIKESITDTGIQQIMLRHLETKDNDPTLAFSPDGIDEMNRNILILNKGKKHQPIYKVRVYEKAEKFTVGQKGNKRTKFVEAAKGTNLFFAIYETEEIDKDTKKVIRLVNKLRQYGFKVEMDDFGSGYSSLNMLKDIKMDTIKLDMGFLRKTRNNERSMSIVSNVIHLSKRLGMEVVTEGVETREQVDALTMMGCDVFQGYYFAKPMSVWDYEDKYISTEG